MAKSKGNLKELLGEVESDEVEDDEAQDMPGPVEEVGRCAILELVEGIEVEAVVGGALQRVRWVAGTDPSQVGPMLKFLDPGVKLRDDFPRKGFGNRETKLARVLVVSVRVTDSGKFWDLVAQNGEDLSISVPKKASEDVVPQIQALGKVGEKHLSKLQKAIDEKGTATVILPEAEQFGAKYWTTDDGKAFLDSFEAEPPAAKEAEENDDE